MTGHISTRTSKLTCLCGAVSEPGSSLVAEQFPIECGLCSCEVCRQSTGALGVIPIRLNGQPSAKSLTACQTHAATDRARRYFCSTCGSHMFIRHSHSGTWFTLGGVIERTDDNKQIDTVNITKIGFLGNTRDGGLAGRWRTVALTSGASPAKVTCYVGMPGGATEVNLTEADTIWNKPGNKPDQREDKVLCSCHCGNVQFNIIWPDAARNDLEKASAWLRANRTKYRGSVCTCRSCRLATSTPCMPWIYAMPENILTLSNEPVDVGYHANQANLSGTKAYHSGSHTKRSFCATCGATIFFEDAERPQVVDISIGIIRSVAGVMAEDVVDWDWGRVSWRDESFDNGFLKSWTG